MATKNEKIRSVVTKSDQSFSKPQVKQPSNKPSKIQSMEDCISHLSNTQRLTFELERFGHFTIEGGDRWTQAEIDTEWVRINAAKAPTDSEHRSAAFVLNCDFEPEYIIVNDDQQPSKPVIAQSTPANYWDEWRAREGIVVKHLTPAQ